MTVLNDSQRISILKDMIRIRVAEQRIADLYGEQEMRCPTHLCIGQEAVPSVVSSLLKEVDLVFSGHRSHGHYIAKGGDLNGMFAELYGRATGCASGKGGSQHLVDLNCGFMGAAPILTSTVSVGVGAAWAAQLDGRDQVSVVYFGDGATEEGTLHESMNFAAVRKLPVIFVCENNMYSVHSAMDIRQPENRPIARLAVAHGMPGDTCDGNDVDAVHQLAAAAIDRARAGNGPSLIECMTYRWMEHCGPGDDVHLGYRDREELADWKDQDPIAQLRNRLGDSLSDEEFSAFQENALAEANSAVAFAQNSPWPEPTELDRHVLPAASA